jgi:hypothetical protein
MSRSDWERELEPELTTFGRRVAAAAGIDSYVEFHESRRYFVSGNLVFTPAESRERELAVVSVQADYEVGWLFDLTNEASTVLAEATAPATSEGTAVRQVLVDFLRTAEPVVLSIVRDL